MRERRQRKREKAKRIHPQITQMITDKFKCIIRNKFMYF
jgi:hypothetical protein